MMRNLILLLLFVLSGLPWSQQVNYEPHFQVGKKYVYNYESILLSGLPEKELGRAGISLRSEVEVSGRKLKFPVMKIGISGRCNTTYFIKKDKKDNLVYITKSKDLNDCKESVQMNTGFAYAVKCKECRPPNRNSRSTSTSAYKIKTSEGQPLIIYAEVQEIHQFTPFHELTGGEAVTQV